MLILWKVGFNVMWCARNEVVVLVSSVIDKCINEGVSAIGWSPTCFTSVVVHRLFVSIPIRDKEYSFSRRRLYNCSLSWKFWTGSVNF